MESYESFACKDTCLSSVGFEYDSLLHDVDSEASLGAM